MRAFSFLKYGFLLPKPQAFLNCAEQPATSRITTSSCAGASTCCHELVIDAKGFVSGYKLRMPDQKRKAVEAFKGLNFKVISTGDSYNDLSMLRAADCAVLYRPTDKFAAENSDLPVARDYAQLREAFERFMD